MIDGHALTTIRPRSRWISPADARTAADRYQRIATSLYRDANRAERAGQRRDAACYRSKGDTCQAVADELRTALRHHMETIIEGVTA